MSVVSQHTGRRVADFLRFFAEFFGENPEFVPEIAPHSKESGRNKLADVRCDAEDFQTVDYEVIEDKIDQSDDSVARGYFGLVFAQLRIFEDPISLEQIVDSPADQRGDRFGPEKAGAEAFVDQEKSQVARPEISATAYHILGKSFGFSGLFFGDFHF